jgi:SAM-dependent methyltransferase
LTCFYDLGGKRILDYGCGGGSFAELFGKHSPHVFGCDASDACLDFARENTSSSITYFKDDFFNSNLETDSYDFIFCRDLGPLQKIDYTEANVNLLKRIVDALNDGGVGYFILMGNLSGIPGDRLTGFQNHRIDVIHDFFRHAGYVSMINVFGYQAVVICRSQETAVRYWRKMDLTIRHTTSCLMPAESNRIEYLKCRMWSFLNERTDEDLKRKEFLSVDKFMMQAIAPRLIEGLCCPSYIESSGTMRPATGPLFLVSGDQDRFFETYYERELFKWSMTLKEIGHLIRKKIMK